MIRNRTPLQHEQVSVAIAQGPTRLKVPADVYMRPETTRVTSLWVHGFGAGRRAIANTLAAQRQEGFGGAAVVLPYHLVPTRLLEAFTDEAVPQVMETVCATGKIALAGDSRGAGAAIRGAGQMPERVQAAAFLEPAFINSRQMGETPQLAVRSLLQRLALDNPRRLKQPFCAGARETARKMAAEMGAITLCGGMAALEGGLRAVVDHGVADRTIERLGHIVKAGVPTVIMAGVRDPLFPPHEYRTALEPHALDNLVVDIPAAHVSPATPEGLVQVERAMQFVGSPDPRVSLA